MRLKWLRSLEIVLAPDEAATPTEALVVELELVLAAVGEDAVARHH